MLTRQIFGPLLLCADVSATVKQKDPEQMSRAVSGSGLSVRVYLS